jgi:hypothetical protein
MSLIHLFIQNISIISPPFVMTDHTIEAALKTRSTPWLNRTTRPCASPHNVFQFFSTSTVEHASQSRIHFPSRRSRRFRVIHTDWIFMFGPPSTIDVSESLALYLSLDFHSMTTSGSVSIYQAELDLIANPIPRKRTYLW